MLAGSPGPHRQLGSAFTPPQQGRNKIKTWLMKAAWALLTHAGMSDNGAHLVSQRNGKAGRGSQG